MDRRLLFFELGSRAADYSSSMWLSNATHGEKQYFTSIAPIVYFEMSDCRGKFFPMIFFCTSQRPDLIFAPLRDD
ncbi:hypothetical protein L916_12985 [Phytophthora nicotianae]|uniref:MULE transposase domain-containing protein n=1 Tax=Phytophthora nicotianae TaxID=4792 RepID=W2IN65_PHYNI|nr:hypothetical protein L916_12985 [Phytophthora nicotianae]